MPARGIGVADEVAGAGVVEYRTRERSADGVTACEQHLIPQRERVVSFRGMCGDWWSGNASGGFTPKTALSNLAGSAVLVAVRACIIHVVPWATVSTSPVEFGLYFQAAATASGGNVLGKVSVGTGADAAQSSSASVVVRSRHSADNSAASSITLTLGSRVIYKAARPHTTTTTGGQMVGERGVYPGADFNMDSGENDMEDAIIGGAIILRGGQSLAVASTGVATNVSQVAVTWLWDEYTLP